MKHFDPIWDTRFADTDYAYGKEPNDFLRQQVNSLKKGKLLTLAEGEGRNAVFLAKLGFEVTAVDASIKGLNKAQLLASQNNVSIATVHADLTDFDPGEHQWDCVVSIFAPLGSAFRKVLHADIVRSLKPGGTFLIEAYTPEQVRFGTGGGNDPDTMLTSAQVEKELEGLNFDVLQQVEREVVEGKYHTGRASVVQALGEKPG